MPDIILASASPRRRHFMQQLSLDFEIVVADIDETPISGEKPEMLASRLAREKAEAVSIKIAESDDTKLIVASDTVVFNPETTKFPLASYVRRASVFIISEY